MSNKLKLVQEGGKLALDAADAAADVTAEFNKVKTQTLESIVFNLSKKDITFLEKLRFTYNYKDLVYLVREFFKNYLDLSVQEELLYLL